MKIIIKKYDYIKVHGNKLENLEEMDDFWLKHKLLTLTLEEVKIKHINSLGRCLKIDFSLWKGSSQNVLAAELYLSFEEKTFLTLFKPYHTLKKI